MQASGILEQNHAIYSTEIYSFGEIALGELLGLTEVKTLHGALRVLSDVSNHKLDRPSTSPW